MSKRGRKPFLFTSEILLKVERLAARGLAQKDIAYCIGMHPGTLSSKTGELDELNEIIKRGQVKGLADVTNSLFESAMNGTPAAQIFYLKNRDPDRWSDVQSINAVQINVSKLTDSHMVPRYHESEDLRLFYNLKKQVEDRLLTAERSR